MNLEESKRAFSLEPTVMNAKNLINNLRRAGEKLPDECYEILEICHNNEMVQNYISAMDYGNPSGMSYWLGTKGKCSVEFVKGVLEKDIIGDSEIYSYWFAEDHQINMSWAIQIIDRKISIKKISYNCRSIVEQIGYYYPNFKKWSIKRLKMIDDITRNKKKK